MIKQFVPSEACLKCQGCCRFREANSVWSPCLLDEEILELIDKPGIPAASLSIWRRINPVPDPAGGGFLCPFLKKDENKCCIYAIRPFECQLYPFLLSMRGRKALLTVDLNCPYVRDNINEALFKEYSEYLAAYLNSPSCLKLLKDNPHLLQAYEDVAEVVELRSGDDPE